MALNRNFIPFETKNMSQRIWTKVFERSSLRSVEPALLPRTCMAFLKELSSLKALFAECAKYSAYIVPLSYFSNYCFISFETIFRNFYSSNCGIHHFFPCPFLQQRKVQIRFCSRQCLCQASDK